MPSPGISDAQISENECIRKSLTIFCLINENINSMGAMITWKWPNSVPDHECQMYMYSAHIVMLVCFLRLKFRWGFPTSSSWCLCGWPSSRRCSPSGSGATGTRPPPTSACPGSLPSCSSICSMTSDILSPPYQQKSDLRTRVISTPSHMRGDFTQPR